ncbi:Nucleoporin NUP1 [Dirofilaria immitis]
MPGQSVDNYGKAGAGAEGIGQKSACFMPAQGAAGYGKGGIGVTAGLGTEGQKSTYFISEQSIFDYGKGGVGTGIKPRAEAASAVGTAAIAEGMGQKSVYFIPGQGTGTELQLELGQGDGHRKLSISAWSKFLDW